MTRVCEAKLRVAETDKVGPSWPLYRAGLNVGSGARPNGANLSYGRVVPARDLLPRQRVDERR